MIISKLYQKKYKFVLRIDFVLILSNPITQKTGPMSKPIFLFLLLLSNSSAFAQNQNIDSLLRAFRSETSPNRHRLDLAVAIGGYYYYGSDLKKAEYYYQQELETAQKLKDPERVAYAYHNLSFIYKKRGDLKSCSRLLAKAEANARARLPAAHGILVDILVQKASMAKQLGNRIAAISINLTADKLCRQYQDSAGIVSVSYNIGSLYDEEKEYAKALTYHKTAYDLASRIRNNDYTAAAALGVSNSHYNLKDYDEAEKFVKVAQKLAIQTDNVSLLGYSLEGLGQIALAKKKYEASKVFYEKALQEFQRTNDSYGTSEVLLQLGILQSKFLNNPQAGLAHLNNALQQVENSGIESKKLDILRALAYTKLLLKYDKNTAQMIDSIGVIQDRVFGIDKQKIVTELETKYETEKKDVQLAKQKITLLENQQRITLVGLGALLIILFLLGIFAFYRSQQRRRVAKMETQFEATTQQLQSFNYSVSHDLRNPLLATKEALRQMKPLNTHQETQVQKALKSVANMTQIIEGLLALVEIERNDLMLNDLNMNDLVADILAELSIKANVTVQPLPNVRADVRLLRQVLVNLIANAAKYSQNQPHPEIRILARSEPQRVVVEVQDNGVGFDPRYASKLFQLFGRLNPSFEGIGIGLVLVKRIVEKHGGRVWAKGALNQGATFGFELPT